MSTGRLLEICKNLTAEESEEMIAEFLRLRRYEVLAEAVKIMLTSDQIDTIAAQWFVRALQKVDQGGGDA